MFIILMLVEYALSRGKLHLAPIYLSTHQERALHRLNFFSLLLADILIAVNFTP